MGFVTRSLAATVVMYAVVTIVFGGGALLISGVAPAIPGVDDEPLQPEPIKSDAVEEALLEQVNDHRKAHGLPRLQVLQPIQTQTERHAELMRDHGTLAHTIAGSTATRRIQAAGCDRGAENAALSETYTDLRVAGVEIYTDDAEAVAETLFRSWNTSAPHRDSIESPAWRTTGLSVAIHENGTVYASQMFC